MSLASQGKDVLVVLSSSFTANTTAEIFLHDLVIPALHSHLAEETSLELVNCNIPAINYQVFGVVVLLHYFQSHFVWFLRYICLPNNTSSN
mgnify:CR=1 FL=1